MFFFFIEFDNKMYFKVKVAQHFMYIVFCVIENENADLVKCAYRVIDNCVLQMDAKQTTR